MHIKSLLQEAAQYVNGIACKRELARFSSHVIRVGSCVLLHAKNISA